MSLLRHETLVTGSNNKPMAVDITCNTLTGKCPVILYAHGFNGFKDWGNFDLIAQQFAAAGFTFVKFNFSHNGTTPEHPQDFTDLEAFGENNYTKELYDLEKMIDWISAEDNPFAAYLDADQIGLIGHSMGGGISILKTAEDKRVKVLVTWAAISECKTPWAHWPEEKLLAWKTDGVAYYANGRTKQQMPMYYQLYQDFQYNAARLNILKAAGSIQIPFLICHGTADTSVTVESAYRLQEANPGAALLLTDSDHVFGRKHPWTGDRLPDAMQTVVDKNIGFFKTALQ